MDSIMSPMQFLDYRADKIHLEINHEFHNDGGPVNLNPQISVDTSEIENDLFSTTISVHLRETEESGELPFYLDVVVTGRFKFGAMEDDLKKSLMNNNAAAILLPYLRSIVTTITATANIPPLVLPLINVHQLVQE